jgi:hypothetical protein
MFPGTKYVMVVAVTLSGISLAMAKDRSCKEEVGNTKARMYVRECIDASPATHPPCHVDNLCEMIISEIQHGCEFLREGAPRYGTSVPTYCAKYDKPADSQK